MRRLAREDGASPNTEQELVERARVSFRVVDGRAVPGGADGRTVLMTADGARMLTVAEWLTEDRKGREGAGTRPQPPHPTLSRRGGPSGRAQLPPRNPFRKKFWNLTEQMRLQKQDPQFWAKLKAEAWVE